MAAEIQTKNCCTCKQDKPVDQFYGDKRKKDGLYPRCKACHKAANDACRKKNPEKSNEQARKYRAANTEKVRAIRRKSQNKKYAEDALFREAAKLKSKEWYEANKGLAMEKQRARNVGRQGEVRTYNAIYYQKNSASIRNSVARYAEANKVRLRPLNAARAMRRVAMKLSATPPWANKAAIDSIYVEARKVSEETGVEHQVDHVVPLQHPLVCGLHVEKNLRIIPRSINQSKGNRYWPDCPDEIISRLPKAVLEIIKAATKEMRDYAAEAIE